MSLNPTQIGPRKSILYVLQGILKAQIATLVTCIRSDSVLSYLITNTTVYGSITESNVAIGDLIETWNMQQDGPIKICIYSGDVGSQPKWTTERTYVENSYGGGLKTLIKTTIAFYIHPDAFKITGSGSKELTDFRLELLSTTIEDWIAEYLINTVAPTNSFYGSTTLLLASQTRYSTNQEGYDTLNACSIERAYWGWRTRNVGSIKIRTIAFVHCGQIQ